MDLAKTVASPKTMVIGERTYNLSPLTLRDFGELDLWLRATLVERARQVYAEAPADLRTERLKVAFLAAERVSFATAEGATLLATPEGTAQILWRSLCKRHPEVTLEGLKDLVTTENLKILQQQIDEVNRLIPDPQLAPETPGPARR